MIETWYEEHGSGDPLVFLDPGGADARALAPNLGALAEHFRVFTHERRGQGRTPDVDGPITYERMAQDTIDFLEEVVGGPAHLVGNSGGAGPRGDVRAHPPRLTVSRSGARASPGWRRTRQGRV